MSFYRCECRDLLGAIGLTGLEGVSIESGLGWPCLAWLGLARFGQPSLTRPVQAWLDSARPGLAKVGQAWTSKALSGLTRPGQALLGLARLGHYRLRLFRAGLAIPGFFGLARFDQA